MASQKTLALLCLIFVVSCSNISYNLEKMPDYNLQEVLYKYNKITEAEIYYLTLNQFLYKIEKLEFPIDYQHIYKEVDTYLYWSSIAKIQIFHSDFKKSNESIEKATEALNRYKEILIKITKDKNI